MHSCFRFLATFFVTKHNIFSKYNNSKYILLSHLSTFHQYSAFAFNIDCHILLLRSLSYYHMLFLNCHMSCAILSQFSFFILSYYLSHTDKVIQTLDSDLPTWKPSFTSFIWCKTYENVKTKINDFYRHAFVMINLRY